ncbi:MAG: type III-B CRISPR module-associated Cmr3 family protein [Anaerolineae bacterium]
MMTESWMILRPLGPVSFRWGGVTSPLLRGSMSGAMVSPLPLPSTVEGFLRSSLMRIGVLDRRNVMDPRALQDLGISIGPVALYLRGGGEERFCVNAYGTGGRLVCGNPDGHPLAFSPPRALRIGVALDRGRKSALEGYLYSMEHMDLRPRPVLEALRESGWKGDLEDVGIAVSASADGELLRRLVGLVGPLGGEGTPIVVEGVLDSGPSGKSCLLASPALIDRHDSGKGDALQVEWGSANASLRGYLVEDGGSPTKVRPVLRLISRGFALDRRLPMSLAAMPGPIVDGGCSPVGHQAGLGWGGVLRMDLGRIEVS